MHNRPDRAGTGHRRYRPVGTALGHQRLHPLRETLITQLSPDPVRRHQTLARRHTAATAMIRPWKPPMS
jgi:hypothetical protein